jgi:hypothetical protein
MLGAGVVRACDFRFHTVSCGFRLLYWNVADVAGPYQSAFTESHSLKIKKNHYQVLYLLIKYY